MKIEKRQRKNKKNFLSFLYVFFIFYILFFIFKPSVFASSPNNKFGIHLAQPHFEDLKAAAQLVNSSGGDWGYVTLVIEENDRNQQKWQEIFDQLRQLHLIPIVRLATKPEGPSWQRPDKDDVKRWVDFLDSLNWVVKNRYLILFNEPNHANEWGGEVDPKNYTQVAFSFAKALKEKNLDFFVMLAGLDASAPHQPPQFEDEEVFLKELFAAAGKLIESENTQKDNNQNIKSIKGLFDYIDGWVSHSYPNPAFSGSPWDWGRATVRTYQWELGVLRSLGLTKKLPVFITETGWKRDIRYPILDVDDDKIAQNFKITFENVWLPDENIVAVTPFVLDYQSQPFLGFSWKKFQSKEFYPQYYLLQSLPKTKGEPERREKGEIIFDLPKELVAHSQYQFNIKIKNQGQAIWDKNDSYSLLVINSSGKDFEGKKPFDYFFSELKNIKPFEEKEVTLFFKTISERKDNHLKFILQKNEKKIMESKDWFFKIEPLPVLDFYVSFWPTFKKKEGNDFEIQIFDKKEKLIFKKKKITVKKGWGRVKDIQNITLGEKYRIVILKPYYLPRQNFIVFEKNKNKLFFKKMLPFDFNQDNKFDFGDIKRFLTDVRLIKYFLPDSLF